mmetsp:Transcript_147158/g.470267  ORF Transcript_147158/g.470267 Transcript_147158/m.470267 type:complete len:96 (+) Transcript_147158:1173-1460(+)
MAAVPLAEAVAPATSTPRRSTVLSTEAEMEAMPSAEVAAAAPAEVQKTEPKPAKVEQAAALMPRVATPAAAVLVAAIPLGGQSTIPALAKTGAAP